MTTLHVNRNLALGVCYHGRIAREGVCSAPCRTDAECPSHTLCAFVRELGEVGHCFVDCADSGGAACELLNDAFDDPLYCADRVDVDAAGLSGEDESGQICIPASDQFWVLPVTQ